MLTDIEVERIEKNFKKIIRNEKIKVNIIWPLLGFLMPFFITIFSCWVFDINWRHNEGLASICAILGFLFGVIIFLDSKFREMK